MRKLRPIAILAIAIAAFAYADAAAQQNSSMEIKLPLGITRDLWEYYVPKDNPVTPEKVELGRELFFDKRLSADGTVSCATCHDPKLAFTDGKRVAEGIGGRLGVRNTPTLLNAMFNSGQFWDGRAGSLEEQAKMPLTNPDEMGSQTHEQVVARVAVDQQYSKQFKQAFGKPVTIDLIAKAIATYERTLVAGNSPVDRYLAGDLDALSESARNGMILFRGKARCTVCHTFNQSFPFLSDMNYRNTGVAVKAKDFDRFARRAMDLSRVDSQVKLDSIANEEGAHSLGRFLVTGIALDIGAFKVPSLRNVELTAPYFHDGSAATLEDVVKFYLKGGMDNPNRDWQLEPIDLTESEQHDLVEFLKALTSNEAKRMAESAASNPAR
ncbi:MAG TPA: cytochrome c peroxidase [Blastocatellia bacterium]|nr:cytochrome c peroxidase [Blastocatellia bacterium]